MGRPLGWLVAGFPHRVLLTRAADVVRQFVEARDTRAFTRLQQRLRRVDGLIGDELGLGTDRLPHHATVLTTNGKSYRMRKRRSQPEEA
jgi:DNA replication protein DnaC